MNKKNLKSYRNKLDKLDNKIFVLIKKRTHIVKYISVLKKFKNQIVDHKRINEILKKIKNKSIRNGIDPKISFHKVINFIRFVMINQIPCHAIKTKDFIVKEHNCLPYDPQTLMMMYKFLPLINCNP